MFLFIFESIGTSELLLVGIVALIFLGPRRLPEMAKKAGKIMSEFRGTANEFKETWQREVNFEEEVKMLNLDDVDAAPVARVESISAPEPTVTVSTPSIRSIDLADFEKAKNTGSPNPPAVDDENANDKRNWL